MEAKKVLIFAAVIGLFAGVAENAFALTASPITLYFNLGWAIQDMKEGFLGIFSVEAVQKAKSEHIIEIQKKIEEKQKAGLQVDKEDYSRIEAKLHQIEIIQDKQNYLTDGVISSLNVIAETNEIRKIVSDYQSKKYTNEELQTRINALESVKQYCTSIPQITEFEHAGKSEEQARNVYQKLQELCPILKTIEAEKAYEMLNEK